MDFEEGPILCAHNSGENKCGPDETVVGSTPVSGHQIEVPATQLARDLTPDVTLVEPFPVSLGGFSDIYRGVWVLREVVENVVREIPVRDVLASMVCIHYGALGCVEGFTTIERETELHTFAGSKLLDTQQEIVV